MKNEIDLKKLSGKELFEYYRSIQDRSIEDGQFYSMLMFGVTYMGFNELFALLEQHILTGKKIEYEGGTNEGTFSPSKLILV